MVPQPYILYIQVDQMAVHFSIYINIDYILQQLFE